MKCKWKKLLLGKGESCCLSGADWKRAKKGPNPSQCWFVLYKPVKDPDAGGPWCATHSPVKGKICWRYKTKAIAKAKIRKFDKQGYLP